MEKAQRRKKIISRGTDRMALITGRISSLDPDPITKCSSFNVDRSGFNPPTQHVRSSSEPLTINQEQEVSLQYDHRDGGHEVSDPSSRPYYHAEEISKGDDSRTKVSSHRKLEQKQRPPIPSDNNVHSPKKQQQSPIPSDNNVHSPKKQQQSPIPSDNNVHSPKKQQQSPIPSDINVHSPKKQQQCNTAFFGNYDSVTAKEINFSIITTEDTRAFCSIALGILVVLSHVILPRNVERPKTFITYRPLYVILLTDALVVAARLAPFTHRVRKEETQCKSEEDDLNIAGVFKYLETGLVLHQTIRGFFIDCCFYLAVVVIGLSLVK